MTECEICWSCYSQLKICLPSTNLSYPVSNRTWDHVQLDEGGFTPFYGQTANIKPSSSSVIMSMCTVCSVLYVVCYSNRSKITLSRSQYAFSSKGKYDDLSFLTCTFYLPKSIINKILWHGSHFH